jgi:hypothetical protein
MLLFGTVCRSSCLTFSIWVMTDQDPGRETRVVHVRDRAIVVAQLIDTQLMLLLRCSKILQRDDVDVSTKLDHLDRMFRILQKSIVQAADREFLEELMEEGALDLRELMSFVTIFQRGEDVEAVAPKVRRARTTAKRA